MHTLVADVKYNSAKKQTIFREAFDVADLGCVPLSFFKREAEDLYAEGENSYMIRLKGRFADELELESKKTGLTRAAIVKLALNQYFGKMPKNPGGQMA